MGTRHGLGTWPSELDGASAAAVTAAVKTEIEKGPERWRAAGIGSGDAAAHDAVEDIINEEFVYKMRFKSCHHCRNTRYIQYRAVKKCCLLIIALKKSRTLCGQLKITSKLKLSRRHSSSRFTIRTRIDASASR